MRRRTGGCGGWLLLSGGLMLATAGVSVAQGTDPKTRYEDLLRSLPPQGTDRGAAPANDAAPPSSPVSEERPAPPVAPDAPLAAPAAPAGTSEPAATQFPDALPPTNPSGVSLTPAEAPEPPPEPLSERASISWRVENPFRFFNDPADSEVHRATYLALSADEKVSPILSAERALERRHVDGWAATMYRKTCWNFGKNRFECSDDPDYINPKSHRIVAELKGISDDQVECSWLTAPKKGASGRGQIERGDCRKPMTFDVPYPAGLRLTVEIGGREVAGADIQVTDLLIAGIGDSFGSGEGNPDLPVRFSRERAADYGKLEKSPDLAGYPARVGSWARIGDKDFIDESARWLDTACHRSLYSHQIRAALQLAVEEPHRAVTLVDVACSGAEVTTGLFLRYKGNEWVPTPPELSQISAVAEAQCGTRTALPQDLPEAYHINGAIPELQGGLVLRKCDRDQARRIDLLFASVGGNDIGFARLVANTVLADKSLVRRLGGWFGQIHGDAQSTALLDRLDERYKAMNRAVHGILHIPWEESDRVILTAYPPLAVLGDGKSVCPDGSAGMEVYRDFSLNQQRALESSALADRLHDVMAKSARTHGWTFADGHRRAFNGRGICAGFSDNAFSIADDLRLPRKLDGQWQPYNPADFKAYSSRERWFRTPNDAFMTGNFHVSGSVFQKVLKLQSLSWFQVLLASTYGGAFHPTAEGHAAIADAVASKARGVLARYGQGPRITRP
ncbi:MAG: hypothetical protein ACT4N2_08505 [Hyphomicrobium sp.]